MRKTASKAIVSALFLSLALAPVANAATLPQVLISSPKLTATTLSVTDNNNAANQASIQTANPAPASQTPAPDKTVTVQSGDTLIAIAAANQTTYQRLFDANDSLTDPNVINPGQVLRVPSDSEQLPDRIAALPQATQQAVASAASSYSTAVATTAAPVSYPAVSGNDAKAFIYSRESGNNPNATSPRGCYGLGQDCNGRVRAQCGADYACQDAYFTSYATSRYGGWAQAAAFWQTHGWW